MRSATPYICALCLARASRTGDMSRAITRKKVRPHNEDTRLSRLASLAGFCKRDGVASHSTECVQNRITTTSIGNLVGDKFGCNAIPSLLVQETARRS